MEKYVLIPEQLLYEGTINKENLYDPGKIDEVTLLLTHDLAYWQKLKSQSLTKREERRTGFPLSSELIERALTIPMGTIQGVRYAQEYGVSLNGAGGTHHAFSGHGEGFCILNDIAIAANYLLQQGEIQKALVVDLDVHQGNGTASLFSGRPEVFTFSIHCESNYPMHKEESDLDFSLPPYTGDKDYLSVLKETLPGLMEKIKPDIVFYLSGVDVLETDKLGKLNLSRQGCKDRDAYVFKICKEAGVPVSVVLGGGYSPNIRDIVEAHCNTFRLAREIWF